MVEALVEAAGERYGCEGICRLQYGVAASWKSVQTYVAVLSSFELSSILRVGFLFGDYLK